MENCKKKKRSGESLEAVLTRGFSSFLYNWLYNKRCLHAVWIFIIVRNVSCLNLHVASICLQFIVAIWLPEKSIACFLNRWRCKVSLYHHHRGKWRLYFKISGCPAENRKRMQTTYSWLSSRISLETKIHLAQKSHRKKSGDNLDWDTVVLRMRPRGKELGRAKWTASYQRAGIFSYAYKKNV